MSNHYLSNEIDRKTEYGWYYDEQLNNELLSMSLHPNTYLEETEVSVETEEGEETTKKKVREWMSYSSEDTELFPNTEWTERFLGKVTDSGYRKEPICKAILSDDFNVSVGNNWTDFGNNAIGAAFEGLKSLGPFTGFLSKGFEKMKEAQEDFVDNGHDSKFNKNMVKIWDTLSKASDTATDYFNKSLVVQGSQFSYYSGTAVSFSNLSLRFTVFPKYENGVLKDVNDQLEELYPYLIGSFEVDEDLCKKAKEEMKKVVNKVDDFKSGVSEKVLKFAGINEEGALVTTVRDINNYIKGVRNKVIDEFDTWDLYDVGSLIGWQTPPGGYESALKGVDVIQKGTLMLKFGPYYSITNLVVDNATFNFSRQMVKYPKIINASGLTTESDVLNSEMAITPLCCDVTVSLRPCCKFSDVSLRKMISGILDGNGILVDAKNNLDGLRRSRDNEI